MMDIPGLVQSYGTGSTQTSASSQTAASTSYSRSLAITSYTPPTQYTSSPTQLTPHQPLHSPFGYNGYQSGPNRMVSTLHNPYSQARPHSGQYSPQTPITSNSMSSNPQNYLRNTHQLSHPQPRYETLQSPTNSYMVKPESQAPYMNSSNSLSWNHNPQTSPYSPNQISMYQAVSGQSQSQPSPVSASGSTTDNSPKFGTDIDTLMQAIQSKPQAKEAEAKAQQKGGGPKAQSRGIEEGKSTDEDAKSGAAGDKKDDKKRYECNIPGCPKSFYQKTHLEIHIRAHTGVKPYPCSDPTCNQRFSQLGNLKTHVRRHTGERPFQCDICGKRFAQRGNVRAHKITHDQSKPYVCKLQGCGKLFTQLGNLKSHQNKFHSSYLKQLTARFAALKDPNEVSAEERELFDYFATLYKNSNKGIKGRGKDRKIAGPGSSSGSSMMMGPGHGLPGAMSSSMTTFPGMSATGGTMGGISSMPGPGMRMGGHGGSGDVTMGRVYEMDDMDEDADMGSQCESGSGSGESIDYGYDDMNVDVSAPPGRQMGYGDRLY